jgi:hypothetical protein
VEDIVINNSEKIGGVGVVVEIDESKFGKSIVLFICCCHLFDIITYIFI